MFLSVDVTTIASTGDVQKAAVHQVPNSSWSSSKGRTCYQTDSTAQAHKGVHKIILEKACAFSIFSLYFQSQMPVITGYAQNYFFHSAKGKNKTKQNARHH